MPMNTIKEAAEAVSKIDAKGIIQAQARQRGLNLSRLSAVMGMSDNFLVNHFKRDEVTISMLLAASNHLQFNLLEAYMALLPEPIAGTAREARIVQENNDLKKQLEEKDKHIALLEKVLKINS